MLVLSKWLDKKNWYKLSGVETISLLEKMGEPVRSENLLEKLQFLNKCAATKIIVLKHKGMFGPPGLGK